MTSPGPLFRMFGQQRPIFRAAGIPSAAPFPALLPFFLPFEP